MASGDGAGPAAVSDPKGKRRRVSPRRNDASDCDLPIVVRASSRQQQQQERVIAEMRNAVVALPSNRTKRKRKQTVSGGVRKQTRKKRKEIEKIEPSADGSGGRLASVGGEISGSDFSRGVKDGVGLCTLADKDMPFVNRVRELAQIFTVNAENFRHLWACSDGVLSNFIPLKVLFCVQYFGGGKTTLGLNFPKRIKEMANAPEECDALQELDDGVAAELQLLKDADVMDTLYCDLRFMKQPFRSIMAQAKGEVDAGDVEGVDDVSFNAAAVAVFECAKAKPTRSLMVHLDEVGNEFHKINDLRNFAVNLWRLQHLAMKSARNIDAAPRIYLFMSGRSTAPFTSLGESENSPSGSEFVLLDMLTEEHIGEIRGHVTTGVELEKRVNLSLPPRCTSYFDRALKVATAGAPRLLLYAFRALHILRDKVSLTAEKGIDDALDLIFRRLAAEVEDVAREFLPRSSEKPTVAFNYLFALSLAGTVLKTSEQIVVEGKNRSIGRLLRFQPFFMSRARADENGFTLHLPKWHEKMAEATLKLNNVASLFFALSTVPIALDAKWRLFELLIPISLACAAALKRLVSASPKSTWQSEFPDLFGDSELAAKVTFNIGDKPFRLHPATREDHLIAAVKSNKTNPGGVSKYFQNGAVIMPDKSASEDSVYFQCTEENTLCIMGTQEKAYDKSTLNMSTVVEESKKGFAAISGVLEVLTIFATQIGRELLTAIETQASHVLVLKAWSGDTAARYAFTNHNVLLWRSSRSGPWCVFPTKQSTTCVPIKRGRSPPTILSVRPMLEIVIPHPNVIQKLVGDKLWQSFAEPAAPSADRAVTGLQELLETTKPKPAVAPAAGAGVVERVQAAIDIVGQRQEAILKKEISKEDTRALAETLDPTFSGPMAKSEFWTTFVEPFQQKFEALVQHLLRQEKDPKAPVGAAVDTFISTPTNASWNIVLTEINRDRDSPLVPPFPVTFMGARPIPDFDE
eukprot:m.366283 g.366283  ORF g.366283 m.366283 type:complete len:975 (-) comp16658_c2_seq37:170-3094(-)